MEVFGNERTLEDLSSNMFLPACTMNAEPWSFRKGYPYKLWQVARALSPAPTLFEPYALPNYYVRREHRNEDNLIIDGGLWVNNPSMSILTFIKMKTLYFDPNKNNASFG